MNIELSRFRVLKGKEARADEWLNVLQQRMAEVKATLDREDMKIEIIFKESTLDETFLYWFSIRGDSIVSLIDSPHEIDKVHLAYWKECIDPSYKEVVIIPHIVMVNNSLSSFLK